MLTTVQDLGRWGSQHEGVPPAGVMDRWSARLANRLAGNPDTAAVLEVTLIGPVLTALDDVAVAVAGACFDVTVGGRAERVPFAAILHRGESLAFGPCRYGARAYLALGGGIGVPEVLGSRSTHTRARWGGMDGRAVRAGDVVRADAPASSRTPIRGGSPPSWLETTTLRVIPVLADDPWHGDVFEILCRTEFEISAQSDRMGYRLKSAAKWPAPGPMRVSEPVVTGAIQVPAGGEPILLMADRQTTGGYPVVGVVIDADIAAAAQRAPGERITFRPVDLEAAAAARQVRNEELDRLAGGAAW